MTREVRDHTRARGRGVRLRLLLLAACTIGALSATAGAAQATSHAYCNWDGSYVFGISPYALCAQPGANYISQNYGWLPYGETNSNVYCSAALNGVQYGAATVGTTSCLHAYAGANNLTAFMYVGPVSHAIHGSINY